MRNRFVQKGREVRPGQRALVLMRGPGGEFEVLFDEAVFGGPARNESRHYWIRHEGAEPVLVADISSFGEEDETTGEQHWEDVPAGSSMEGRAASAPAGEGLPAAEGGDAGGDRRPNRVSGKRSRAHLERAPWTMTLERFKDANLDTTGKLASLTVGGEMFERADVQWSRRRACLAR